MPNDTSIPLSPFEVRERRCLLEYDWLVGGFCPVRGGGLSPAVTAQIGAERERAVALKFVTRRIPLDWEDDRTLDARFIAHNNRLESAWKKHATITFNGALVHVDMFGGSGRGPGFWFQDARISVGGEVRGRAWRFGVSLGFGGVGGPATLLLRDDLALVLDEKAGVLNLVAAREPGGRG